MEKKLDLILNELHNLNEKVTKIDSDVTVMKDEQQSMKRAIFETSDRTSAIGETLSAISKQVAHNTEYEPKLNELSSKVDSHDADIKLIKRVLTN